MIVQLIILLVVVLFGATLLVLTYQLQQLALPKYRLPAPKRLRQSLGFTRTPTIFIHGFHGNRFSFGRMLARFNRQGIAQKALVIRVSSAGRVSVRGKLPTAVANPTIQLLFSDNGASLKKQSDWLRLVLAELKRKHHVEQVNLVGHSMGAVSLFRYLLAAGGDEDQPTIKKVITLAGPFNDLDVGEDGAQVFSYELRGDGPVAKTPVYQAFEKNMSYLPTGVAWLNIAGDLLDGSDSDGSVSVDSALSLRFLLDKRIGRYRESLITGLKAAHYRLHENPQVDQAICHFLWPVKRIKVTRDKTGRIDHATYQRLLRSDLVSLT
ncbi:hypothetical protein BSQ39_05055 [Loigolactobacillus backii]|nr:hypothetical protein BSQ39_05055 [Loigolactobacillus backii]